MPKPPSFLPNRSPKNVGTIHFMLEENFGVNPKGLADGLCNTLADFVQKSERSGRI